MKKISSNVLLDEYQRRIKERDEMIARNERLIQLEKDPKVSQYLHLLDLVDNTYINLSDSEIHDLVYCDSIEKLNIKIMFYMYTYIENGNEKEIVQDDDIRGNYKFYYDLISGIGYHIPIKKCEEFEKKHLVIYSTASNNRIEKFEKIRSFIKEEITNNPNNDIIMKLSEMEDIKFTSSDLKNGWNFIIELKKKSRTEGLTIKDYIALEKFKSSLDQRLIAKSQAWYELYQELIILSGEIYNSGILHHFSKNDLNYIKSNSPLLPLVLANNEDPRIKMKSDGYLFLCQFHLEKTPSMHVWDFENSLNCYGCGIQLDTISYLMKYEEISFKEAVQLLSQIYLFDVKEVNKDFTDIVKKYQQTIISDQYILLLKRIRQKLNEKYNDPLIDKNYSKRFSAIERIKNGQYDTEFHFEGSKNKIYLKK